MVLPPALAGGSNYLPASAANELEMWQAETFDPREIDKELGWAEGLGMNTMRVFLHDLLWQDVAGFQKRLDAFLAIAARHHIRPILVLFDSCWDPNPTLGPQHAAGARRTQFAVGAEPGAKGLSDPAQEPRLRAYVEGVVGQIWQRPPRSGLGRLERAIEYQWQFVRQIGTPRQAGSGSCVATKSVRLGAIGTSPRSRSPAESGRENGRRLRRWTPSRGCSLSNRT